MLQNMMSLVDDEEVVMLKENDSKFDNFQKQEVPPIF